MAADLSGELLPGFPVVVELPVAWGDMDFFRHVNNTVFFRYFESARIAYLERIGFEQELNDSGVGPILASTHCRFRRPLTYPDTISVGARTTELKEERFMMEYRILSHRLRDVAAEGSGVVVAFDYRNRSKVRVPEAIRRAIRALDGERVVTAPV